MDDTTKAANESDADKLVKAVEAAGYVHPDAPEGFATPGHKMAAEHSASAEPTDHLKEISALAEQAKTATPSGVQSIADQIHAHVEAMK